MLLVAESQCLSTDIESSPTSIVPHSKRRAYISLGRDLLQTQTELLTCPGMYLSTSSFELYSAFHSSSSGLTANTVALLISVLFVQCVLLNVIPLNRISCSL